jgi:hypothetical protein
MFNKYQFIEDLKSFITSDFNNFSDLQDLLFDFIENNCIYYSDCFDIIKELNFTDFNHSDFGICDTVNKAAFCALYDLIHEQSDIFELYDELKNSLVEEV